MNEGIHLDLDTWIVPGQIRKANLCRGLGNRYIYDIHCYVTTYGNNNLSRTTGSMYILVGRWRCALTDVRRQ